MEIFLGSDGSVSPEWLDEFTNVCTRCIPEFHTFLEEVSQNWEKDLDWWVSSFPSRNTFASPLFYNLCGLVLAKDLVSLKKVDLLATDSIAICAILFRLKLKYPNINVELRSSCTKYLKEICHQIYSKWFDPLHHLSFWFWAKFTKPSKIISEEITLLSLFTLGKFDETKDRYFPNLLAQLTQSERNETYFLPVYSAYKNVSKFAIIKSLRSGERNFLLKEDFLKLNDYIYAFLFSFRSKKFLSKKIKWYELEVTELLCKEYNNRGSFHTAQLGILHYRLMLRMKEKNVKFRSFINFFENQVQDKGFNRGIWDFYPNAHHIGYVGYCPVTPFYLCTFPIELEYRSRVIPKLLAVCGNGYPKSILRYFPKLPFQIAPLYRSDSIWNKNQKTHKTGFTILFTLSHLPQHYEYFISVIKILLENMPDVNVIVKPHPIISNFQKIHSDLNLHSQIKFEDVDIFCLLEKADVLFSSASGTCVDALARGVRVGILKIPNYLLHNPIPDSIPQGYWRICNTISDVLTWASEVRSLNDPNEPDWSFPIRQAFYEPVKRDSTHKLLGYFN